MKRSRIKPFVLTLGLCSAAAVSVPAMAQNVEGGGGGAPGGGGDNCGVLALVDCGGPTWTSDHKVEGTGWDYGKHSYCGVCVEDPEAVPLWELDPAECHPNCGGEENDDFLSFAAFASVQQAARAGDMSSLLAVAPLAAKYVRVNLERQSIQVLSCDLSTVIANLPMGDRRVLFALADRLPTTTSSQSVVNSVSSLGQ